MDSGGLFKSLPRHFKYPFVLLPIVLSVLFKNSLKIPKG